MSDKTDPSRASGSTYASPYGRDHRWPGNFPKGGKVTFHDAKSDNQRAESSVRP